MSGETQATGSCLCGAVSFEVAGEPMRTLYCHCAPCRRSTGAPVAAFVIYAMEQVTWSGERKLFESSPGVQRGFCADCGTPLSYEGVRVPGESHLYVSTFANPAPFMPQYHVFMNEKIGWFDTHDHLPRWATSSSKDDAPMAHRPVVD